MNKTFKLAAISSLVTAPGLLLAADATAVKTTPKLSQADAQKDLKLRQAQGVLIGLNKGIVVQWVKGKAPVRRVIQMYG